MYLIRIIVRVDGHVAGNLELGLEDGQDMGDPGARRDNHMFGFQRPVRRFHANGVFRKDRPRARAFQCGYRPRLDG